MVCAPARRQVRSHLPRKRRSGAKPAPDDVHGSVRAQSQYLTFGVRADLWAMLSKGNLGGEGVLIVVLPSVASSCASLGWRLHGPVKGRLTVTVWQARPRRPL